MDRIKSFKFEGSVYDLIMKATVRDIKEALRTKTEPAFLVDNDFCWLDFKIQAVVAKHKQWFPCQFKVLLQGNDWYAQVQFESKGFSGDRFLQLLRAEEELISNALVEFVCKSMRLDAEDSSPNLHLVSSMVQR